MRDFGVTLCALLLAPAGAGSEQAWPAAVSNAGMVWDSASGEVLLYGGMRDRGAHSDSTLWAWNGIRWSAMGDGAPGARSGVILASDPRGNRVLLHGGQSRTMQFDDTWEWRSGRWTRISSSGPGPRHMTAGVFDPARNQLVLFGGYAVEQQTMLGDTWILEGTTWRRSSAEGPPPRAGHSLGFDPAIGKVILMGGGNAQGHPFADTWSWDGSRWTRLGDGPAITPNTQLVRVPGGGLGTFGGWDGSKPSGALFYRNGARWETRELADGPSPRMETALAFDATRGRVVLFGGSDAQGSKLNDLWEYDGQAWRASNALMPSFATSGAFFGLSVPDLEASIRWYSDKLGLRVTLRPPAHEGTEVAVLEGSGLIVELIQHPDAVPLGQVAPQLSANYLVHGYFKAGVVVDDFEATLAMLRSKGVEIAMGPFPARPGQRANVLVRDNAGNLIQFFGR